MKKIMLVSLLSLLVTICYGESVSIKILDDASMQVEVNVRNTARYDDNTISILISEYFAAIKCNALYDGTSWSGEISNLYFQRFPFEKKKFSISYKLTVSKKGLNTILSFLIPSIETTTIKCNKQQQETKSIDAVGSMDSEIQEVVSDAAEKIASGINKYISQREVVNIFKRYKEPPYYMMDYVVEDGQVTYYKVINSSQSLSGTELFMIMKNYFTYAYNHGSTVIQVADSDEKMILAKGVYAGIDKGHRVAGTMEIEYSVPHIIRVDCKDGRVRVIFTINEYQAYSNGSMSSICPTKYKPFALEYDRHYYDVTNKTEKILLQHFIEISDVIQNGNTSIDTDEW